MMDGEDSAVDMATFRHFAIVLSSAYWYVDKRNVELRNPGLTILQVTYRLKAVFRQRSYELR
ncbi:hypothetical protein C1H69_21370 [Billgrantia endophytica]|uniref:Uncharacterized protein n=1 Tax=Billgrantia endophytica TaxID=2033802 RepID=A0A2N7TW33_9GAMM|nr:hypothetical protein C1H69_21370 [Halomonas endophytica]